MKRHAVWPVPIALALVSLLGLVAGLLGDDLWDWAAWAGLGVPVAACAWFGFGFGSRFGSRPPAKPTRAAGAPPLPTIDG